MQTFLPYPSFAESAECLDDYRLERQRRECFVILAALQCRSALPAALSAQPVVDLWSGYASALAVYTTVCCDVYCGRGHPPEFVTPYKRDTFLRSPGFPGDYAPDAREAEMPPWMGREDFHKSHQQALLWKLPVHYRQFGWRVVPKLDYVWPTTEAYECV